jgi:hypothetical protein
MVYIEQWPLRFVAHHRSTTLPDVTAESLLDDAIDSLEEAHSRVQEMLQTAENEYGAQLVDVELQEFGEDGTWSAVGRFYVEGPE